METWMACSIYRCRVLAVVALCAQGKIVGGGKSPLPGIAGSAGYNIETEVLAMVILVVGEIVENHPTIHLLHIIAVFLSYSKTQSLLSGVSESEPTGCSRKVT